jgi:hypothetical protein
MLFEQMGSTNTYVVQQTEPSWGTFLPYVVSWRSDDSKRGLETLRYNQIAALHMHIVSTRKLFKF